MEHVQDHKKAIDELYRVLKNGGTLIAQVPIDLKRQFTIEDNSITDPKKRSKIFGQYDHLRIYGKDYFDFLDNAGFTSQCISYTEQLSQEEIKKYGLKYEQITRAIKG